MGHIKLANNLFEITASSKQRSLEVSIGCSLFCDALAAEENRQGDLAIELYRKSLEHDQSLAASWINMGTIFYYRCKYSDAAECYRKAIGIDPGYALAHFDLANTLDTQSLFEEAAKHYQQAIAIDPRYADAHYNLALLYRKRLKNNREALKHYRQYLAVTAKKNDVWANEVQNAIQQIVSLNPLSVVSKAPLSVGFSKKSRRKKVL
jgi:tetratricopeptide (TPR) repeat protein